MRVESMLRPDARKTYRHITEVIGISEFPEWSSQYNLRMRCVYVRLEVVNSPEGQT